MDVASGSPADNDPLVRRIADIVAPPDGLSGARILLIAGPPGFGKTSVLASAAELVARRLAADVIWVSGGVVASEGHLARLLAGATEDMGVQNQVEFSLETALVHLQRRSPRATLLAIDDIDALVFKRERVAEWLVTVQRSHPSIQLLGSCHGGAADRLVAVGHPFADAMQNGSGPAHVVTIDALDDISAHTLIRRRSPRLSDASVRRIIAAAGGHPAALVFLSRLAELRASEKGFVEVPATDDPHNIGELIEWAAEYAGAVYAESWAGLGPQQRAILWQLGCLGASVSASEIADKIDLPASHVSAQLTRLVTDGLVRRTLTRGQFTLAPLLARWIARRAARGQQPNHCEHKAELEETGESRSQAGEALGIAVSKMRRPRTDSARIPSTPTMPIPRTPNKGHEVLGQKGNHPQRRAKR